MKFFTPLRTVIVTLFFVFTTLLPLTIVSANTALHDKIATILEEKIAEKAPDQQEAYRQTLIGVLHRVADKPETSSTIAALLRDVADLLSHTVSCEEAIQAWLDQDTTHGDTTVADGHNITVYYIGRFNDTDVFDTNVESVALACGTHTPGRDYSAGLSFTVGAGQMIAGFDAGVVDKKHGEIFTISIPAAEAYGEYDDTRTQTVSRDQVPAGNLSVGDKLTDPYGRQFAIKTITDTEVILDLNHELAGKDLIFDIMIMDIQE